MKTYYEKLRDPRWQMRRLEVMKYYEAQCYYCDATDKELHIHHVVYVRGRDPWEYPDNELICVCKDCHEQIEAAKIWLARMFAHAFTENWRPLSKAVEQIYEASANYGEFQINFDAWLKKAKPKKKKGE